MNSTTGDRRQLILFLLFAFVLLAAGLGLRDPWPSDEPRFTLVAKQMVESGDWMFPHRGHELYSDKPPMLMWMEAAAYSVIGNWRVAFMLPSLLAALLTLGLTWDLGRRLWSPKVGLYAAFAVLFTFQFMFQMKRAQIDPLVTGFITLGNWGILLHCLRGPHWRAYWLGCFAAGLGVITKGVGVLALLMLLPYVIGRFREWPGIVTPQRSAWRWALGGIAFLAAIALWLVPMLLAAKARGGEEYLAYANDILFRQTAKRYADSWSHAQPFWYFGPILLFNWFPLSLAYLGAVPLVARAWRSRNWRDLIPQAVRAGDARVMLPLLWTLLIVIFFSIPRGKRDVYVMPAIPMVALMFAPWFGDLLARLWMRRTIFALTLVGGIILTGAGLYALQSYPHAAQDLVQRRGLAGRGEILWWMLVAMGCGFLVSAAIFRTRRALHGLLAGSAALWLLYSFWAYPVLNDSSSGGGIMRTAGATIGADAELGLVAWKEQNLLLADRPVAEFGFKRHWPEQFTDAIRWQAQAPEKRWIFALDQAMGRCVDRSRASKVGTANRRDWWVFRADAVVAGCVPAEDDAAEAASDQPDDGN
ncbi:MAG: glycosyltransferase family 39 protein [Tahibacter sp.]